MFSNQLPNFLPPNGPGAFRPGVVPGVSDNGQPASRVMPSVAINDIYQAAKNRAVEEHEIDKLFNAEFYGDCI
jgi:hypothetical protein